MKGALLALVACMTGNTLAQNSREEPLHPTYDIREGCRRSLSGMYLDAYDQKMVTQDYVEALSKKEKLLTSAMKEAEEKAKTARTQADNKSFDLATITALDEANEHVALIREMRVDVEKLLSEAKRHQVEAERVESELRAAMMKVFVLEKNQLDPSGAYPIKWAYKDSCPRFRSLCPLPVASARLLRELLPSPNLPTECERYSTL